MYRPGLFFGLTLVCLVAIEAHAQEGGNYTAEEIADGVIVFSPPDIGLGNVVAVVSDQEAVVIDATGTPELAQGVLRELRDRGVEVVRALINTHWHDDHVWGNQVFVDSFPGVAIVAHPRTRDGIRDLAVPALAGQVERLHATVSQRDGLLQSGLNIDGTAMSEGERTALVERQALFRDLVESLESVRPTYPNTFVVDRLTLRAGSLEVIVRHLGPGHTLGDLVVEVPARRVVIAGDLLTRPVPAAAEASVLEWPVVLEQLGGMSWDALVPGHGGVERDRLYLDAVRDLFEDVEAYVRDGMERGMTIDDLVAEASFEEFRRDFVGDDQRSGMMYRAFTIEPAIRSAHSQLSQRRPPGARPW